MCPAYRLSYGRDFIMDHSSSAMPQLEGSSEILGRITSSRVEMKPRKTSSYVNVQSLYPNNILYSGTSNKLTLH